jgi:hypothetical protein
MSRAELLTGRILSAREDPSDQRERPNVNRAVARIGWRPCRPVVIFLGLSLLAASGCRQLMDPKEAKAKKPGPKQLSVADVLGAYNKDAAAFKSRYRDSQILVRSPVYDVGKDKDGGWVNLGSGDDRLRCEFPAYRVPDLAGLARGQEIAVLGVCRISDTGLKLTECTVIRAVQYVPKN